jgi:hypothetical protein
VLTSSPQEFLNLSASLEHLRSVLFDLEDSLQNLEAAFDFCGQYIKHLVTV